VFDASRRDATLPDAMLPDAMQPDAALPDAALPDAMLPDAALPDAGCVPHTCAQVATHCAPIADGCGGQLNCAPPCTNQEACQGAACVPLYPDQRVGIFYLTWHAYAAEAMRRIPEGQRWTVEDAIRDPALAPAALISDRELMAQAMSFHYHAEPEPGFYCFYRPRDGQAPFPAPHHAQCGDISQVAERHARQLWDAGVDFVYADLTNIPFFSRFADVLGVRPIEVLFEEWAALRARGVMTPQIAVWVPMPPANGQPYTADQILAGVYNDPRYDALVLRDPASGRKVWFAVENGGFPLDPALVNRVESNGGRDDMVVVPMWGLNNAQALAAGRVSWMQPCQTGPTFTTLIDPTTPCNQGSAETAIGTMLSVSASYQISYASLPFASSGTNLGLTLKKQFEAAFTQQPDWLLINAWNEHIAQPQFDPARTDHGPLGRSMSNPALGVVSDTWLWVDMYGTEFSRDIEPTVEGGDGLYTLMASCLRAYRAGGCGAVPNEACCDVTPEYALVWSMRAPDPAGAMNTDHVPTADPNEMQALAAGGWEQVCAPFYGPPYLCATQGPLTGDGPFMLFSRPGADRRALYRCNTGVDHFVSLDPGCEGLEAESRLGYVSAVRHSGAPRPLSRCYNRPARAHFHWLGEQCPDRPGVRHEAVLGFVR
jgi:hypothetical protein